MRTFPLKKTLLPAAIVFTMAAGPLVWPAWSEEEATASKTKDAEAKPKAPAKDSKKSSAASAPASAGKESHGKKTASGAAPDSADADEEEGDDNDSPDSAAGQDNAKDSPLLPENENGSPFTPSREEANRRKLNTLLPPGSSHRGVYFPSFRAVQPDPEVSDPLTGAPAGIDAPMDSLFKSDIVTRLDEDHVQFDQAHWVQFDAEPAPDGSPKPKMKLDIERGVYDLKNQILMTNQPVRIENQQLILVGDSMLHDRTTGLTRLTGRVRMTVFQEEPGPEETPKPGAKPPREASPDSQNAKPEPEASSTKTPAPAASAKAGSAPKNVKSGKTQAAPPAKAPGGKGQR